MEYHELKQRQSLPLKHKIRISKKKIREWYEKHRGQVYISFSGGKDSTVLLHLIRKLYPDVQAVFVDTGLEYPELKEFVKTFDNVITIRPEMNFKQVLDTYGYPVVSKKVSRMIKDLQNPTKKNARTREFYLDRTLGSKHSSWKIPKKWKYLIDAPFKISNRCCDIMKKKPAKKFERETGLKPFLGLMAANSKQRELNYLQTGCNNYKRGASNPLGFWTEENIWEYIKKYKLEYCSIYDTGVTNTGCIFCMFGAHMEKEPNRFQCMAKSHPQLYKYCLDKLNLREVLEFIKVKY